MLGAVKDEIEETKDPKEISKQRMGWLLQVAKALREFYNASVSAGTPGKPPADIGLDPARREHASSLLYSIYSDYDKRENEAKKKEKAALKAKTEAGSSEAPAETKSESLPPSAPVALKRAPSIPSVGQGAAADSAAVAPLKSAECVVCYSAFDSTTTAMCLSNCRHECVCQDCIRSMLTVKIESRDVMPWLICPAANCKTPIHASDIESLLTPLPMYQLMQIYLLKHLSRDNLWVSCKANNSSLQQVDDGFGKSEKLINPCCYGFYLTDEKEVRDGVCPVCSLAQKVKASEDLDEDFKKMVTEGTLRPCPKCKHWTMKEKGICNVICCAQCGIWWNWRTKETGTSSSELKAKARNTGVLWEPGELAYQQELEAKDPAAFKALLERNGMKYDPNYQRGT